jgi:adenine C2-methylase RlmN of 23S rRNA A2503 and tRNA A37/CheY-like chemotaxis protein
MNSDGKLRLLLLDDDSLVQGVISKYFNQYQGMEVFTASNIVVAEYIVESMEVDVAIVDIKLQNGENGKDFCRFLRYNYPMIKIILWSGYPGLFSDDELSLCDTDPVQKPAALKKLYTLIKSMFVQDGELKDIENNYSNSLSCTYVQKDSDAVEGIIAIPKREKSKPLNKQGNIKFVIYKLRDNGPITIGLASSMGCAGKCVFCGSSGKKILYNLNTEEIIDQIVIGATNPFVRTLQGNSYVCCESRQSFRLKKKIPIKVNVNFTCEGDLIVQNSKNVVGIVREINKLDFVERITITTMGSDKGFENLQELVEKEEDVFRKVRIFWSLNSLNIKTRDMLMLSTIHDNVYVQRDLLHNMRKFLRYKITISWIVIKGVNDSEADAKMIQYFIRNREESFEVKIQGLRFHPDFVKDTTLKLTNKVPSKYEVREFGKKLKLHNVPYRIAEIKDHERGHGCGSTRAKMFSYHSIQDMILLDQDSEVLHSQLLCA